MEVIEICDIHRVFWDKFGVVFMCFLMALRCFGRFVVFPQRSIPLKWEIIILMVCPRMEKTTVERRKNPGQNVKGQACRAR